MMGKSLRAQYSDCLDCANRLRESMTMQLTELLSKHKVTLGVPMESRVKSWDSINEKLKRKQISIISPQKINDLIGVRLILLFRSDLTLVEKLIRNTFDVIKSEDTAKRLGESQFGYQSQHYVVKLPKKWLEIPSMSDFGDFKVEIQLRTLAQHIWAAASHKLQYKYEESVPPPLRRAIHRVSALLEIVDLEFERVLEERQSYRDFGISATNEFEPLNVDLLASVLNEIFPKANRDENEPYAKLLNELKQLSVRTSVELKTLLKKHYNSVMKAEYQQVARKSKEKDFMDPDEENRIKRGVFFIHVGLARAALQREFGERATKIFCRF